MTRQSRTLRIDAEALKRDRRLVDVITSYGVALKREGAGTYRALCPFHHEHTPSFWVDARDPLNEHYWCFGQCGAHGDLITFVMEREACSFQEACERLGARAPAPGLWHSDGLPDPRPRGRSWEQLQAESAEADALDKAISLYEQQLWGNERALAYLRYRAIDEEVARKQRLGYADGRSLLAQLRTERAGPDQPTPLELAINLGLVVQRPVVDGQRLPVRREFFFDRLIVPELRGGRAIWCIGRSVEDVTSPTEVTPDNVDRRRRPKYLSLPGEKPILGLELVVGASAAYLVEGPFDWLAALGWGLPAFAVCGTHFPAERLPAFGETQVVYGVFDPDRAGQSAAERFRPLFGSRWRPIRLPNNLDLAELAALGEPGFVNFRTLVGRARASAWQQDRA